MCSIPDYLGLRKVSDMEKEEVRFPREVMNKLIMNYLVTGTSLQKIIKLTEITPFFITLLPNICNSTFSPSFRIF
jgi:hypothetical protein